MRRPLSLFVSACLALSAPASSWAAVARIAVAAPAPVVRVAPLVLSPGLGLSALSLAPLTPLTRLTPLTAIAVTPLGIAPRTPTVAAPAVMLQPTVLQSVQTGVETLQASRSPAEAAKTLDDIFIGAPFSAPASFVPAVTPGPFASPLAPSSRPSASADEEILADLRAHKPSAVIFDYDNTLVDRGPDGLSGAPSEALVAAVVKLLRKGVPVALATSRYFDHQPEGAAFAMTVFTPFVSQIPAELRKNLSFSGGVGGELVTFDEKGEAQRLLQGDWDSHEEGILRESAAQASQELGLGSALNVVIGPGQFMSKLPKGDTRAGAVAEALTTSLAAAGMDVQVLHNREFIYFSKYSKAEGVRQLFAQWRGRGLPVTEESLLIVGDEFRLPHGGDSAMAAAFPKARAITVGDAPSDVLPPSVRRLQRRGGAGSLAILEAIAEGLAEKPSTAAPREKQAIKSVAAAFVGAAAGLLLPFLYHNPSIAAIGGTVALTVIGLPQIWRNFKRGAPATKDLAVGSYLIWLAAACLLTVTSLLRGADAWWIASNLAGVAASFTVIGQLAAHRGQKGLWLKALAMPVASAALLLLPVAAPALATAVFMGAMALLLVLNVPQIRDNLRLYKKEGRIPEGASPLYPALVAGGSLLHLMAALALGDAFWAANAVLAIVSTVIVLGQLFMPRATNGLLGLLRRK